MLGNVIRSHAPASSLIVLALAAAHCGGSPEGPNAVAQASTGAAEVGVDSFSFGCVQPKLPDPSLAVPAGNRLAFSLHGVGVQIYQCQATATGDAWVFTAPKATLFDAFGRVEAKHFAGPTWEANDGSEVVGAKIASFTVDPDAIPWLLLQASSHTGSGKMADVSFVQRLDTRGGLAPATGCDDAHLNDVANVPYTATYVFYEPLPAGHR